MRIYFDNPGENVTLTLYNVMMASQKSCQHNSKSDCSKTIGINEVYVFFSIMRNLIEKYMNFIYSAD